MATEATAGRLTQLKRGNGATPESFTLIAELRDIDGPELGLDTEDVTSRSSTSGWEEVVPTILRTGEVTFDLNFVPSNATQNPTLGLLADLKNRTLRNFYILWAGESATSWNFAAYVTGFKPGTPLDGAMTADVTLKISGVPTLR